MPNPNPWTRVRQIATVALGAALVLVPLGIVATSFDVVRHQHWSYAVLLGVTALVGVLLIVLGLRRTTDPPVRHRVLRALGATVTAVLLVVLVGACAWLRPFAATEVALDALVSDSAVVVTEHPGWYTFAPAGAEPTVGLVYAPGARVDVRATAAVLRPIAEAGYLVVSLKEPLGIALTYPNQFAQAMAAYPDVDTWAVGGHSLGGVAAAGFAGAHPEVVDGLLLHGSYPQGDLSDADLEVTSVSGSNDGLTTPADIKASRARLPASTTFVEVQGAVHADFADYGPQPGDGVPTISRADAQQQIVAASVALLDSLAAP